MNLLKNKGIIIDESKLQEFKPTIEEYEMLRDNNNLQLQVGSVILAKLEEIDDAMDFLYKSRKKFKPFKAIIDDKVGESLTKYSQLINEFKVRNLEIRKT